MESSPLVSVLMTAYNRQDYIAEAIESVLGSTYANFELIIVDDCSTDNTLNIATGFAEKDQRIKLYVNEKNLGDYPNRNRAATHAKGKYLKYLDSDDKLYPDGLNYCVQHMEQFTDADWATIFLGKIENEHVLSSKEAIELHFFKDPFLRIGPGGTIMHTAFFIKIGMYPTLYGPANDMYFNLLAASMGNVLLLKDNFLFYRRHEGQQQNNAYSYLYNNCRYLDDALQILNLPLTKQQIKWLQQKRKRRFVVNIFKHIVKTHDIKKTYKAIKLARFSFADAMAGIFH